MQAGRTLTHESNALLALQEQLDESFNQAVLMILNARTCGGFGSGNLVFRGAQDGAFAQLRGSAAFFLGVDESAHGSAQP